MSHPFTRTRPTALVLAAAAITLTGCTPTAPLAGPSAAGSSPPTALPSPVPASPVPTSPVPTSPVPTSTAPSSAATSAEPSVAELSRAALATLDTLAVKGRAAKTGYTRAEFGQRWSDAVDVEYGRNGCDTRNDILRRDLRETVAKPGTRGCVVESGILDDPYTRQTVEFTRGAQTSNLVQIDHVVALSDAWQKGAQQLPPQRRTELANDPRNLQATQGRINQSKGDADAASWLPPNRSYRCTYAARQIAVKAAYDLWVTAAEKDAMTRVLSDCADQAG